MDPGWSRKTDQRLTNGNRAFECICHLATFATHKIIQNQLPCIQLAECVMFMIFYDILDMLWLIYVMICFVHVATFGIGVRSFGNDQASSNISPPRLQRSGAASSWHLLWSLRSVRPINCSRDFKSVLIYSIYSNSDLNCIYFSLILLL